MTSTYRLLIPTASLLLAGLAHADDIERDPIAYSKTAPSNAIVRLQERLDQGKLRLAYDQDHGYLAAVLNALAIPESSQVLVFSKTSLQRSRISPKTPRALYFNDEIYAGFCQDGQVLEISVADPQLGTVFYTLEQRETQTPRFLRQTDACLLCHGSSQTEQVPGHVVRSVYPDRGGEPILSLGTHRVDQTTPLEDRWGGWYVTGTHGKQTHLGNLIVSNRRDRASIANNPAGQNVTDLKGFLDTSAYLTPHSDIVALMVLEHQTGVHNRLTRASFLTRQALHEQMRLNKELGRSEAFESDTTYRRIRAACEPLVRYLLFSQEARLTEKVQGTSNFARDFPAAGPRDSRGRSLRDFDLERRLFKYPCSYLIYSEAFAHLPAAAKDYVYRRLHLVLTNRDSSRDFDHLDAADRQAILEILRETKSDLPDYWRKQ
jgi:hypothetical protein